MSNDLQALAPEALTAVTGGGLLDKFFGSDSTTHGSPNLFAPSGAPQSGTSRGAKIFGGPGSKGIGSWFGANK